MRILTGVLAAGAVLAVAGCGLQVEGGTTFTEDRSYDVPQGRLNKLSLGLDETDATIVGTDATKVTVHEHLRWSKNRKPTPHHTVEGGQLTLGYSCPRGFSIGYNQCGVGYRIEVPRSMAVNSHGDSAGLTLDDLAGPITVHSDSGAIALTGYRGTSATLSADSGSIRVDGTTGTNPVLQLSADSGDIRADRVQGGRFTARADSGSIRAAFTAPPSLVDVVVGSGSTYLRLPASAPYDVQTRVDSGSRNIDPAIQNHSDAANKVTARADSGSIRIDPAA